MAVAVTDRLLHYCDPKRAVLELLSDLCEEPVRFE
mgnify:CR=1 FL=1